jgi:polysaccharide chain length determinant protein (PEP-CTERM system associated)
MESIRVLIGQYARAAWRRRWVGVIVAWLICCAGWVGVYLVPNQFESSARLYVDADAILTPLLKGIAAESAPSSQLEVLQRTLLSRPNLDKLISKTDLDLTVASPSDRERLIQRLATELLVRPQTKNLFTITYRNPRPKLAHDVVQTLLTIFVESATGNNRTDMENARRFLEHQISSYEQQLRAAEKRRAEFRAKYVDILPAGEGQGGLPAIDTARTAARDIDAKLQDAQIRRDTLSKEVADTPPVLTVEALTQARGVPAKPVGPPPKSRLADAEEQLKLLQLKDTDQHPDVIAQKRLIEVLKKSPDGGGLVAAATAGPDAAKPVPNPVYEQLKVKLTDMETAVSSLEHQKSVAHDYLDKLEKVQREQPGLIAEYQNMDRDYNVLRKNYEELLGRLQAANIAQAADTQADKVKLQVVDPPQLPRLPAAPNRFLLVSGVLVAGLLISGALTVVLGQLDRSFATLDDLRRLGLPVIGGISTLGVTPLMQRLFTAARFGVALAALVAIYAGLMVHLLRSAALI